MCKVLDQNLFAQVDWARNSYYFKELKVGGQIFLANDFPERFPKYFPTISHSHSQRQQQPAGRQCCIIVDMVRAWLWKIFTHSTVN